MTFKPKKDSDAEFQEQNMAAQKGAATTPIPEQQKSILDLPEEVRKNIVGFEDMETDEYIRRILRGHTKPINVDRIVILLYTDYKRSINRGKLLARLRTMVEEGEITKEEGARGLYSLVRDEAA